MGGNLGSQLMIPQEGFPGIFADFCSSPFLKLLCDFSCSFHVSGNERESCHYIIIGKSLCVWVRTRDECQQPLCSLCIMERPYTVLSVVEKIFWMSKMWM